MICYVFFVSKSHSATLFRSNVCNLAEVVSFNTFMFYRYLTSPRSVFKYRKYHNLSEVGYL